jgi:hypothetical protein
MCDSVARFSDAAHWINLLYKPPAWLDVADAASVATGADSDE